MKPNDDLPPKYTSKDNAQNGDHLPTYEEYKVKNKEPLIETKEATKGVATPQSIEDKINAFRKSDFYHHYKDFFDHNLAVYDKLQDKAESTGKITPKLAKIKGNLATLINDITEIETSSGFSELSKKGQNFTRNSLKEVLLATQNVDSTRENVSAGKLFGSASKLAGYSAFALGVAGSAGFIPYAGNVVEKAIMEGIIPLTTGASMKNVIVNSAKEFGRDVYAKIRPEGYLERNISNTMEKFDVNKWNLIHKEVKSPINEVGALKEFSEKIPPIDQKKATEHLKEVVNKAENKIIDEMTKSVHDNFPKNSELKSSITNLSSTKEEQEKPEMKSLHNVHTHHAEDLKQKRSSPNTALHTH